MANDRRLFPDLNPEDFIREMSEVMVKAGIGPELIYAFQKTGRIVSEKNLKHLTKEDIKEWNDAIDEYWREKGTH